MSTLSVTTINTANGTTDLTLTTGNTSGPAIVVGANGSFTYNNVSSFSVGSNVVVNTSAIFVGNSTVNTTVSNGNLIINGNNVSPVQSFRNKLINGNFDFWQRGTSVTGVTSGQYLADRWIHGIGGTTANVSRQAFTAGQTDVPNEPTYFHRSVVTSVAGSGNRYILIHKIESVRTFAGQTATLSFWAKADASKNMAFEITQNFGTGGSPSAVIEAIGVTTCALTASWQKFTVTVNIPSISGKTLGSDNNDWLGVYFWFDAGSNFNSRTNSLGQQSGTFDIAQVQLEAGSVATPFEMRPIGTELALCQRYYQKSFNIDTTPVQNAGRGSAVEFPSTTTAGVTAICPVRFQTSMRASPSVTIYNPSATNSLVRNPSRANDTSTSTIPSDGLGQGGFIVSYTASTSQAIGDTLSFHYAASAEL